MLASGHVLKAALVDLLWDWVWGVREKGQKAPRFGLSSWKDRGRLRWGSHGQGRLGV